MQVRVSYFTRRTHRDRFIFFFYTHSERKREGRGIYDLKRNPLLSSLKKTGGGGSNFEGRSEIIRGSWSFPPLAIPLYLFHTFVEYLWLFLGETSCIDWKATQQQHSIGQVARAAQRLDSPRKSIGTQRPSSYQRDRVT